MLETVRPGNAQTDAFRQTAIAAKEVLRSCGDDMSGGDGGLESGDSGPVIDSVDQIRGRGI
jgi:hypothetical protein